MGVSAIFEREKHKLTSSKAVSLMAVAGAVTGAGFLLTAPIPLAPGLIHLRILAFLPAIFGILYGPRVGFASGAIGTLIWALLGGYFNPATPTFDLVGVGLWGAIPGIMLAAEDCKNRKGLIKATAISTIAVVISLPIIALGFEVVGLMPFFTALIALVLADIPPMIIGTPLALAAIIPVMEERGLLPDERY